MTGATNPCQPHCWNYLLLPALLQGNFQELPGTRVLHKMQTGDNVGTVWGQRGDIGCGFNLGFVASGMLPGCFRDPLFSAVVNKTFRQRCSPGVGYCFRLFLRDPLFSAVVNKHFGNTHTNHYTCLFWRPSHIYIYLYTCMCIYIYIYIHLSLYICIYTHNTTSIHHTTHSCNHVHIMQCINSDTQL